MSCNNQQITRKVSGTENVTFEHSQSYPNSTFAGKCNSQYHHRKFPHIHWGNVSVNMSDKAGMKQLSRTWDWNRCFSSLVFVFQHKIATEISEVNGLLFLATSWLWMRISLLEAKQMGSFTVAIIFLKHCLFQLS